MLDIMASSTILEQVYYERGSLTKTPWTSGQQQLGRGHRAVGVIGGPFSAVPQRNRCVGRNDIMQPTKGAACMIRFSILLGIACMLPAQDQKPFRPQIPRMWDDAAMSDLELPLPRPQ